MWERVCVQLGVRTCWQTLLCANLSVCLWVYEFVCMPIHAPACTPVFTVFLCHICLSGWVSPRMSLWGTRPLEDILAKHHNFFHLVLLVIINNTNQSNSLTSVATTGVRTESDNQPGCKQATYQLDIKCQKPVKMPQNVTSRVTPSRCCCCLSYKIFSWQWYLEKRALKKERNQSLNYSAFDFQLNWWWIAYDQNISLDAKTTS